TFRPHRPHRELPHDHLRVWAQHLFAVAGGLLPALDVRYAWDAEDALGGAGVGRTDRLRAGPAAMELPGRAEAERRLAGHGRPRARLLRSRWTASPGALSRGRVRYDQGRARASGGGGLRSDPRRGDRRTIRDADRTTERMTQGTLDVDTIQGLIQRGDVDTIL